MALNSCSINAFTINSLQCRRRAQFVETPKIAVKSHPYHTRIDPSSWQDHVDVSKLEGPNIRLTISIDGETHSQTYENNFNDVRPLITLSGLTINSIPDLPSITLVNPTLKVKD